MTGEYLNDSIFWVEVDRIKPNPFQPRRTFDEAALASLSESIRQYGVLQPLTVTRKEIERPGEGISVEYELIAGERRLRAAKMAGVHAVPVVIRSHEEGNQMKLELAIIENLQREDLNPMERAEAFAQLVNDFGLKHVDIAKKIGKSREYVSNTVRILGLPQEIKDALRAGQITEGHTRPLLMLVDRPLEQMTLFREVVARRITVRDTEALARRVASDRVRHRALISPDLMALEKQLSEKLGTRVRIERKDTGGKLMIDFFSPDDLTQLCLSLIAPPVTAQETPGDMVLEENTVPSVDETPVSTIAAEAAPVHEEKTTEDDLYSIKNFSL